MLGVIVRKLERFGSVKATSNRALICCVVSEDFVETDHELDHSVSWLRVSDVSFIADVPQTCARAFLLELHRRFFDEQLGASWPNLARISATA